MSVLDMKLCILLQLQAIDPEREYSIADLHTIWTTNETAALAIETDSHEAEACYATYGEQAGIISVIDRNAGW